MGIGGVKWVNEPWGYGWCVCEELRLRDDEDRHRVGNYRCGVKELRSVDIKER